MVIRHDRNDSQYLDYAKKFSAICCLNAPKKAKGVGTLIHSQWVITAAHAAVPVGHQILLNNQPLEVKHSVIHPSWELRSDKPDKEAMKHFADLALIQLSQPVSEIDPVPLYEGFDEIGTTVTFVGRGQFGNGLTGAETFDEQWRAATNKVEEALHDKWLSFRFDEPEYATDLEGVGGVGDSGGPALLQKDDKWFLAGVASWEDSKGIEKRGGYGIWKYYSRISHYTSWILETIRNS